MFALLMFETKIVVDFFVELYKIDYCTFVSFCTCAPTPAPCNGHHFVTILWQSRLFMIGAGEFKHIIAGGITIFTDNCDNY